MKLSFSTLGCPNWSLTEILSTAKDLGYAGVELRGLGEDIFLPDSKLFAPQSAGRARADFARYGQQLACISTECSLWRHDRDYSGEIRAYLSLAAQLGCPYIRLLGDEDPQPGDVDIALVETRLRELLPAAQAAGVVMLVESNGVFADTALLAALLSRIDSPNVQALWDVHHPFRYFGESPETSAANIGRWVRHVHVKDSVMTDGRPVYKMLGYGDLPLASAFAQLKGIGYGGFVSLEWTKRWHDELEDAGIVFAHFAYAAKRIWENA